MKKNRIEDEIILNPSYFLQNLHLIAKGWLDKWIIRLKYYRVIIYLFFSFWNSLRNLLLFENLLLFIFRSSQAKSGDRRNSEE